MPSTFVIELRRGQRVLQTFELAARPVLNLGRREDNDLVLPPDEQLVSGHHAQLRQDGSGWSLHDQNSMNGVFVANRRVRSCPIEAGEEVELGAGGARLRFRAVPAVGRATAQVPIASSAQARTLVPDRLRSSALAAEPPPPPSRAARAADTPVPASRAIGSRTIAMMIQAALSASGRGAERAKRRPLVPALLILLALAGTGLAISVIHRGQAAVDPPGDPGRQVALGNENAVGVFMIGDGDSYGGSCTAFAVRPRVLATNAHCVRLLEALDQLDHERAHAYVIPNRSPGGWVRVVSWMRSPTFSDRDPAGSMNDVGLIEVEKDLPGVVKLAGPETLAALRTGDQIYLYGFPGRISVSSEPEATLTEGVIGRMTNGHGEHVAASDAKLLQHSALMAPGTSGSPIFDRAGEVIAINAGELRQVDDLGQAQNGYGYAIRIDVVEELLGHFGPAQGDFTPRTDRAAGQYHLSVMR